MEKGCQVHEATGEHFKIKAPDGNMLTATQGGPDNLYYVEGTRTVPTDDSVYATSERNERMDPNRAHRLLAHADHALVKKVAADAGWTLDPWS